MVLRISAANLSLSKETFDKFPDRTAVFSNTPEIYHRLYKDLGSGFETLVDDGGFLLSVAQKVDRRDKRCHGNATPK